MAEKKEKKPANIRTRRAILDLLKQNGRMDTKTLAEDLDITQMAVRLHLYALRDEKLVSSTDEPRPLGRPAKMWQLTPAAARFFPNGHADLVINFIHTAEETLGTDGFDQFLQTLTKRKIAQYGDSIPAKASLKRRVEALAALRNEEGYMAEVYSHDDGSLLLVENHCPICTAAANCQGLCAVELEVFQQLLGATASIERVEHIQSGERRCAYRIARR